MYTITLYRSVSTICCYRDIYTRKGENKSIVFFSFLNGPAAAMMTKKKQKKKTKKESHFHKSLCVVRRKSLVGVGERARSHAAQHPWAGCAVYGSHGSVWQTPWLVNRSHYSLFSLSSLFLLPFSSSSSSSCHLYLYLFVGKGTPHEYIYTRPKRHTRTHTQKDGVRLTQ